VNWTEFQRKKHRKVAALRSTKAQNEKLGLAAEVGELVSMFKKVSLALAVFTFAAGALFGQSSTAPLPATPQDQPSPAPAPVQPSAKQPVPAGSASHSSQYHPDRFQGKAGNYYATIWGVDSLSVKWTESGEVIRFSYRILDAEKAKMLNDKKAEPGLFDSQAHVKLVVPSLEKVGQLRQSGTPEAGKVYWMAFSNKGRLVKKGHHVSVVIGQFRADGLVVD
jgi:hypothetical protein